MMLLCYSNSIYDNNSSIIASYDAVASSSIESLKYFKFGSVFIIELFLSSSMVFINNVFISLLNYNCIHVYMQYTSCLYIYINSYHVKL